MVFGISEDMLLLILVTELVFMSIMTFLSFQVLRKNTVYQEVLHEKFVEIGDNIPIIGSKLDTLIDKGLEIGIAKTVTEAILLALNYEPVRAFLEKYSIIIPFLYNIIVNEFEGDYVAFQSFVGDMLTKHYKPIKQPQEQETEKKKESPQPQQPQTQQ